MTPGVGFLSPMVLVLLPVYNGEKFLQEQIDSILAQSHTNLLLICRDDGSSDTSLQILQSYTLRYPERVRLVQDNKGNLGASASFSELMCRALEHPVEVGGVYFALADQDDVWRLDRLERGLERMLAVENNSPQTPVLVHSDLRVVNAEGLEISNSFIQYQGLNVDRDSLSAQLLSNTLTGCTALVNRQLLLKSLPIPEAAVMHDWWLSIVASSFGRRSFISAALVDYRQHGGNTVGARPVESFRMNLKTLRKILLTNDSETNNQIFIAISEQTSSFLKLYGNDLSPLQRFIVRRIVNLRKAGVWQKRLYFRLIRRF